MIKIVIETKGKHTRTVFNYDEPTVIENSLAIREMERIKQELLSFEYKPMFEVTEGDEEDDEE